MDIGSTELQKLRDNADRAGDLLKVMANNNRLLILCQLLGGEKSVHELQEAIGLSQSAISQQLAILRAHRMVSTRRQAQSVFYSLDSPEAAEILRTLYQIYCA
ncbi:MAG: transcriptional regulator [Alphaproteobacteria bacterium]|nr:MAG: transcriptional regulator [Alphaproteobacteria bacterium]